MQLTPKKHKHNFHLSALLACIAVIGSAIPAKAMNLKFTYAPGTSLDHILAYEMAGHYWSDILGDNMTANLYVEMTNALPDRVAGGALPGIVADYKYDDFLKQLQSDITSTNDQTAFNNLKTNHDKTYKAVADGYALKDGGQLNLTRANAKALGVDLKDKNSNAFDGIILMNKFDNQGIKWNLDQSSNNLAANSVDFLSVITHEIGHTLGFVSMVDDNQWLFQLNEAKNKIRTAVLDNKNPNRDKIYQETNKENNAYALDLFRYSPESTAWNSIDLSIGGEKFFSIDGKNPLSIQGRSCEFSTGEAGDGYQGSHWKKKDISLGIMDPEINFAQRRDIKGCDKAAFDAMGYNLKSNTDNLLLTDSNYRTSLYNRAIQNITTSLGRDANWLLNNKDTAAAILAPKWTDTDGNKKDDRGELIDSMIKDSQVYDWRIQGFWWRVQGFWQTTDKEWQGLSGYLNQDSQAKDNGLWQLFDWQVIETQNTSTDTQSVPEPSGLVGILGVALLGIRSLFKVKSLGKK
jgi:hypothetical protein